MNKQKNSKHRRLKLGKETIVHLTDGVLKQVIGGSDGSVELPRTYEYSICITCAP